jgi:RNA polymerase sigma-70 factor (ECF subfamily)
MVGQHYELTDPDVRLMLSVRQGNAGAFEQLVRRYQDRILAILRHLITQKESAEDLAQEVFLRVYRARETYAPNAKFSTWIFTITQNVAKNANRQFSRKRETQMSSGNSDSGRQTTLEQLAADASGLQPTRQLAQMEMGEVVRLALESLPQRQRMAVMLAKFESMSYQEIADTMGLTVPAIKSLLSRARNNLKDALQPYFDAGMLPKSSSEGSHE